MQVALDKKAIVAVYRGSAKSHREQCPSRVKHFTLKVQY